MIPLGGQSPNEQVYGTISTSLAAYSTCSASRQDAIMDWING